MYRVAVDQHGGNILLDFPVGNFLLLNLVTKRRPADTVSNNRLTSFWESTAMTEAEMIAQWEEHIGYEFSSRDVSSTIATMVR